MKRALESLDSCAPLFRFYNDQKGILVVRCTILGKSSLKKKNVQKWRSVGGTARDNTVRNVVRKFERKFLSVITAISFTSVYTMLPM